MSDGISADGSYVCLDGEDETYRTTESRILLLLRSRLPSGSPAPGNREVCQDEKIHLRRKNFLAVERCYVGELVALTV